MKTRDPDYKKDYQEDWDAHRNYISRFDALEAMLIGQVYDSVSKSVDGSKITDSYATTLAIERSARVVGKLPEGVVEAAGKSDQGKAAFMDILRQKHIYPNANSQHSFKTKMQLWQLYSSVYGYMPMFYDWNTSKTGYIGPDCWLWSPRNLVPQVGRTSISDMDYVWASTTVGKKYIQDKIDSKGDGWDLTNLKLLEKRAENLNDVDPHKDSQITRERMNHGKKGIKLITKYEAGDDGEWITFAPDHGYLEVRRIKNPHKTGKIPFVIKYSQELFDSFYGIGDFQRAKPLQFARDGLTNFYFKGIKMNLVPPLVANAHTTVAHTLDYTEGQVMLETAPNSIRQLNTSTAGLSTYQAAQTALTGSLLSLYGSQNASIPGAEALNPSQGKTPAAIRMFSDKEATRDGLERNRLESAIEELTDGFFELLANIGTEEIPINLFAEDIQAIREAGLEDVVGLFTNKFKPNETATGGELKIKASALKNATYRFNITPGSTAAINKDAQLTAMEQMIGVLGKYQNIIKDDPNVTVNWGEILGAYENLVDIKGVKKFITVSDGPSQQELDLMQQLQDTQQQLQQTQMQAQQAQQQSSLAPPSINAGGVSFNNPDIGNLAQDLIG